MGAGGGEAGREHRRIPLKDRANQYQQQPGGLKASPQSLLPSVGRSEGRCLDTPLGMSAVTARGRAWGTGAASPPAGWVGGLGRASAAPGGLGDTESPWEPILGPAHPSTGRDRGDLLGVLPSHVTGEDAETHEGEGFA